MSKASVTKWQRPYWAVPLVRWMSAELFEIHPQYLLVASDKYNLARWQFYAHWAQPYFRQAACFLGMIDVHAGFFGSVEARTSTCSLRIAGLIEVVAGADANVTATRTPGTVQLVTDPETYKSFLFETVRRSSVWNLAWRDDGRSPVHLANLRETVNLTGALAGQISNRFGTM